MKKLLNPGKSKNIDRISFGLLCIFSGIMVLFHLKRLFYNFFWIDTAFSVNLIRLPVSEIIGITAQDTHPPFYYIFARLVYLLLGDHAYAYRMTAFLPYVGILVLALTLVRKYFGYAAAFITVGFASFTPASIVYVVETRMYELGCFLILFSYILMYILFKRSHSNEIRYWVLFYLFSILAAYTHYYMTVAVCIMYVTLIIYCLIHRKNLRKCFVVSVLALLAYLPWLGILISSFEKSADEWWATEYSHFDEVMREIFALKRFYYPAITLIILMLFILIRTMKRKKATSEDCTEIKEKLWITVTGILMVALVFSMGVLLSRLIRPFFLARFMYPLSAVGWVLLGMGIETVVNYFPMIRCWSKAISAIVSIAVSVLLIFTCYTEYLDNNNYQSYASDRTNRLLEQVTIPEGSVIYSEIERGEYTIAETYFPLTEAHVENSLFFYMEPKEEAFYLVWKDADVEVASDNLIAYGYDVSILASGGALGAAEDISILYCSKK